MKLGSFGPFVSSFFASTHGLFTRGCERRTDDFSSFRRISPFRRLDLLISISMAGGEWPKKARGEGKE